MGQTVNLIQALTTSYKAQINIHPNNEIATRISFPMPQKIHPECQIGHPFPMARSVCKIQYRIRGNKHIFIIYERKITW